MGKTLKIGLPIFIVAINMRAGLIMIGPLIPILHKEYGTSIFVESLLASAPLICFSITAWFMNNVIKKYQTNKIIFFAVSLLTSSLILRTVYGLTSLLIFSITLGIAVAILNYMLPVWVRENVKSEVGLMTGTYAAIMGICSSISLAITVPLSNINSNFSWRMAMIPWFVIGLIATFFWYGFRNKRTDHVDTGEKVDILKSTVIKNSDAWALTIFFGCLNMIHYASAAWLPTVLISKGFDLKNSGYVVSIATLIGAMLGLAAPHYATRMKDFRLILMTFSSLLILAYLGIILDKGNRLIIWVILGNIGIYVTFAFALFLIVFKTEINHHTKILSLMTQSVGYLMATMSPLIFGAIFSSTNNWQNSLAFLVALAVLQVVISNKVGKDTKI